MPEIAERCLVADVLGGPDGWEKLVAEHADDDPFTACSACGV